MFFHAFGGTRGTRGTLALGATFAAALLARPIGAVLFGHLGDRLGRKSTLIATMTLMGLSTFAIGLLPSYDTIGVAAPVLLVILRFLQGLAVGGEWAGAALLVAEFAPPHRRGRYGMFPQLAAGFAVILSAGTFLAVFALTGNPATDPARTPGLLRLRHGRHPRRVTGAGPLPRRHDPECQSGLGDVAELGGDGRGRPEELGRQRP